MGTHCAVRPPLPTRPLHLGQPVSPLLALQTVLQLSDPGLHLHHQPLFVGPVGTFQVENPAL